MNQKTGQISAKNKLSGMSKIQFHHDQLVSTNRKIAVPIDPM